MEELRAESLQQTQQIVAAIWAEILRCPATISQDDGFFALGGDSLAVMMMTFQVNERFAMDLQPDALMESPSFGGFCSLVERTRRDTGESRHEARLAGK